MIFHFFPIKKWLSSHGLIRMFGTNEQFQNHQLVEGLTHPLTWDYPLVNKQFDPENHPFLMETSLPTPTTARVELLIYQRVA